MKKNDLTLPGLPASIIFLGIAFLVIALVAPASLAMRIPDSIRRGPGITEIKRLSEWSEGIKATNGDTDVFVLDSGKPGGSALVIGGTHPNEPAGFMAALLIVENAVPETGKLYVIPQANASAFTHSDYMEGQPRHFIIEGASGQRIFRFGSRATSPVDQWPDPDIYIHASSGQRLSGSETRNLNRAYPGRRDGTLTEQVAFAITSLVRNEGIDVVVDLHEASPEYPVINSIVAHENAIETATFAVLGLELEGISMGLEPSPRNLRGLSHRELGDSTRASAFLMETANPAQGRLRGITDETLIIEGKDPFYLRAAKLGRLFVPFDEQGWPLEKRVGRHLAGISAIFLAWSEEHPDHSILLEALPTYDELIESGLQPYL